MITKRIINLVPPILDDNNIKEKIICVRGHRERLFRTSNEIISDKLICHNYGQGGAGWTFLFGCVNSSIYQFEQYLGLNKQFKNKPISIIGAGCYGLLTAIILAQKGYSVRIVADSTDNLSSYKAAGFFFPRPRKVSTIEEIAIFENVSLESYSTYLQIINHGHPFIKDGAKVLPAYFAMDIDPGFAPFIKRKLIEQPEKVIIDFGNGKRYDSMEYRIIFIDAFKMMEELQRNIKELGINIFIKKIESFSQIEESIIFNCAGLGAKELVNDNRLIPVQGHLISLKNQNDVNQIQYLMNFKVLSTSPKGTPRDELIYFAPKQEGILGITFIRGEKSLNSNQHEFDRLLSRSRIFFGS